MEIEVITKKWGGSLGAILPKSFVEDKKLQENEKITIEVKKRPLAGDLFGAVPHITRQKTAQQLKDDAKKGW